MPLAIFRYNCTSVFRNGNEAALPLTMVSKDRTQRQCYAGSGDYGTVKICPGFNVTLVTKSQEVDVFIGES